MTKKKRLGEILMEAGVIDEHQLKSALNYQKQWGGRLGRVLVDNNWLTHEELVEAIQLQTNIELISLEGIGIDKEIIDLVPVDLAERHTLLPIELKGEAGRTGEILVLAVADPTDLSAQDEVQFYTGKKIKLMLASEPAIIMAIKRFYRGQYLDEMSEDFFQSGASDVQFRGHEMDVDDFKIVTGQLESEPGETDPVQNEEVSSENEPEWSNSEVDDPFADLSKGASSAEPISHPVDSVEAPGSEPTQEAVQAIQDVYDIEKTSSEEDLPEVEIVEDLSWDQTSSQTNSEPLQPQNIESEYGSTDDQVPAIDPVVHPDDPPPVGAEYAQIGEESLQETADEIKDIPDLSLDREIPLDESPKPLADSSWLNESLNDNDKEFDFFNSVPTNLDAFGVSGDLLGSEPLVKEEVKEEPFQNEQEINENQDNQDDGEQSYVQTDQLDIDTELKPPKEMDLSFSKMEHLKEEVTMTDDIQRIRMEAVSENRKLERQLPEKSPPSFVVEIADEVQNLLDGLESDQISEEPPTIAKSSHLIAAVIRLLLKRGVFSEVDLMDELKQR